MVKGVIFDMDGVLIDNRDVHFEAFMIFCKRHGFECDMEKLLPLFGKGNDEIIPALVPAEYIEKEGIQPLADEKEQIYREIISDKIAPAPGLITLLDDLKDNGIKCAVGSSGPTANVNFVLEKCGITGYFDSIANGDMVEHAKPDPAVFILAAEKMGLRPSECVVIEDAFAGIEAAHRAGCKVIAMATTYPIEKLAEVETDMLIKGFGELSYDIISRL